MSSGRKLASKGGPTSTGGVILEGNENLRIEGKIIASIGQFASCPACSAGQGPIVAVGERTLILPAGPAALEGDYIACGCPTQAFESHRVMLLAVTTTSPSSDVTSTANHNETTLDNPGCFTPARCGMALLVACRPLSLHLRRRSTRAVDRHRSQLL
ncbi:PAAR domain-containing protein [Pseudomonas sp. COW5]|uniref:PAAR domain-containing protein n=1 Tax=Pseudomonas sp. COW5 TaxID=2981253 RepID=UPI00224652F4|nr:PAAR domain-containing protein [Pseudomonas sp. COW5]MCX2544089.1 PAAR domain-containing protein [Pseudomonas sp. COW5]